MTNVNWLPFLGASHGV